MCEMKVNSFPMDSLCSSPSLSSLYPIISQRRLLEERKRDKGIRPLVSEIEGDDGNGWSFLSHFSSLYLSSLLSLSLTILLFPFPLSFATSEQDERERGK